MLTNLQLILCFSGAGQEENDIKEKDRKIEAKIKKQKDKCRNTRTKAARKPQLHKHPANRKMIQAERETAGQKQQDQEEKQEQK